MIVVHDSLNSLTFCESRRMKKMEVKENKISDTSTLHSTYFNIFKFDQPKSIETYDKCILILARI